MPRSKINPGEDTVVLNFRVSQTTHRKVRELAEARGSTMSEVCRALVEAYIASCGIEEREVENVTEAHE